MDIKLTVRVPQQALKNAKLYAQQHHTTLTKLISSYLDGIPNESSPLKDAPIVRQLSGVLPQNLNIDDYKKHLDEKYGQ